MTPEHLLDRLRAGEDTLTELKTTGNEAVVKKALVALANSALPERAGVLFLGVKPGGEALGVENPTSLGEKVSTWAAECYPPIQADCVTLPVDGRNVLAVVVRASAERPHFAAPAYVRDGPKTVKAPPDIYEDLIASRNTKAGAILRHKGEIVTVTRRVVLTRMGIAVGGPEDCRIESCSAHSVEVRYLGSGRLLSFPLDRVVISADPKHQRPLKLTIKPE
ncbi:MAG: AlbA family DNA-binding domain-containing protein [Gammaproteobacteria bacterium]